MKYGYNFGNAIGDLFSGAGDVLMMMGKQKQIQRQQDIENAIQGQNLLRQYQTMQQNAAHDKFMEDMATKNYQLDAAKQDHPSNSFEWYANKFPNISPDTVLRNYTALTTKSTSDNSRTPWEDFRDAPENRGKTIAEKMTSYGQAQQAMQTKQLTPIQRSGLVNQMINRQDSGLLAQVAQSVPGANNWKTASLYSAAPQYANLLKPALQQHNYILSPEHRKEFVAGDSLSYYDPSIEPVQSAVGAPPIKTPPVIMNPGNGFTQYGTASSHQNVAPKPILTPEEARAKLKALGWTDTQINQGHK